MTPKSYINWSNLANRDLQQQLESHLDEYNTYLKSNGYNNRQPYLVIVKKLLITQSIPPHHIQPEHIESFLQTLPEHTHKHTINLYISRIRNWLRYINKDFADYIQQKSIRPQPKYKEHHKDAELTKQQDTELTAYLDHMQLFNRASTTIDRHTIILRLLQDQTLTTIQTITETSIRTFIQTLKDRQLQPSSINSYLNVIRTYLTFHNKQTIIKNIPPLKQPKPLKRRASYDHVKLLLQESTKPQYPSFLHPLLSLISFTGIRIGSILKLETDQLDFDNRWIRFWTKGDIEQPLPIHKDIIPILKQYIENNHTSNYLFPNSTTESNRPLQYQKLSHWLHTLSTNAKLPYYNPHSYRRAIATWLFYKSNENILFVSTFLNHSNLETTKKYIDIDWDSFKNTYDDLTTHLTKELLPTTTEP